MLAAGLFAGFVAGMFGIGGGFVVVPALAAVLTIFAGVDGEAAQDKIMHVAIGTSLATIVFTSLTSVRAHSKRGTVDLGILKGWMIWIMLGVVGGVLLTSVMDARGLKLAFGLGVLIMGFHFVYPILGKNPPKEERLPKGPLKAALGSGLGAFSSMLGIGGGTPAVLIMTMSGVNMHRAVGTAAGFGTIIAVPGAIGSVITGWGEVGLPFGSLGYVNLIGLVAISAMSILTAPLGVAAAHKLNAAMLKRVFGCYLIVTSVWMLRDSFRPMADAMAALVGVKG